MRSIAVASIVASLLAAVPLAGWAKLPPPTPEALAKAEEAKAKAAEATRKEAELLLRYQDRVVANWAANAQARGIAFQPTPVAGPQAVLPAAGTVVTADKAIPKPAEAAASPSVAIHANTQPAQAGGVARDSAGGAGKPVVVNK